LSATLLSKRVIVSKCCFWGGTTHLLPSVDIPSPTHYSNQNAVISCSFYSHQCPL
jgi:hypothetical protein